MVVCHWLTGSPGPTLLELLRDGVLVDSHSIALRRRSKRSRPSATFLLVPISIGEFLCELPIDAISTLRSMNTKASCASKESMNPRIAAIGSCIGTRIARAALPAGADIRFRDQFHADSPSRRQKSATVPTERPPGTSRERRIIAPLDPLLRNGGIIRQMLTLWRGATLHLSSGRKFGAGFVFIEPSATRKATP